MSVAIVTGSGGLVGSEAVRRLIAEGLDVFGVDNGLRERFFGEDGSVHWNIQSLTRTYPRYRHFDIDIRNGHELNSLFSDVGNALECVIHAAAQPSHDWAARDPLTDFDVNARGTLLLLEAVRDVSPEAPFIFTSTNKVYGDRPNTLPFQELETRWELSDDHPLYAGIDESMSVDQTMHSVFGASKVSADMMVQEYGRYFGLKTACFRGGCLTGSSHSGAQLHGFLAYLFKCALAGRPYTVVGYGGKQVRDNIHASDLVSMFWAFVRDPRSAAVYNVGGGRERSCSVLEAISAAERLAGREMEISFETTPRKGDHQWWITSLKRFRKDYPDWSFSYSLEEIYSDLVEGMGRRA